MAKANRHALLAGHSPSAFLQRYWQKEALLVRRALPDLGSICTRGELMKLSGRDDVEARIIVNQRGRWSLIEGPLRSADFRSLPATGWTLLVQGVNLYSAAADALLRRFAFLPYARLDDVMVSYAVPGGGVGPHYDSYDVFLLQGTGRRRWRYGRQSDLALKVNAPLKILRRFAPQHEAVLEQGDLLYLPPSYAHDGVAVTECTTYSIGFRAPAHDELAQAFLDFLRDRCALPGRYFDPDLAPTREPARIGRAMQDEVGRVLARIHWDSAATNHFLGSFLSEPKPVVVFTRPSRRLGRSAFAARIAKSGVHLDLRTQWLYDRDALYINGEAHPWPVGKRRLLATLANARKLGSRAAAALSEQQIQLLHGGYHNGFLHIG